MKKFLFLSVLLTLNNNAIAETNCDIKGDKNVACNTVKGNLTINYVSKKNNLVTIPTNIFAKIHPGIQTTEAKDFLGEPRRKEQNEKKEIWLYSLKDGAIQLDIINNKIIAIVIEVNKNSKKIPIEPLSRTLPEIKPFLGEMNFNSLKNEGCSALEYLGGARSAISYTKCYFGRPGMYFSYIFGVTNSVDNKLAKSTQNFDYAVLLENSNLELLQGKELEELESLHCLGFSICPEYLY